MKIHDYFSENKRKKIKATTADLEKRLKKVLHIKTLKMLAN